MTQKRDYKTIHFAFVYVASLEGTFVFRNLDEIFIREYFERDGQQDCAWECLDTTILIC